MSLWLQKLNAEPLHASVFIEVLSPPPGLEANTDGELLCRDTVWEPDTAYLIRTQSHSVRLRSVIIPILLLTKVRTCFQSSLWWSQMANPSSWLQRLPLKLDTALLVFVTAIFRTRVDVHWGLSRITEPYMIIYCVNFNLMTTLTNILIYSLQLSSPSFTGSPRIAPWDT